MDMQQDQSRKNEAERSVDEAAEGLGIERIAREMGVALPGLASGFAQWLPSGLRLRRSVMEMSLSMHEELDYSEVKSPSLAPRELFERSGHAQKYGEMMFSAVAASDGAAPAALMLRPMSCPNHLSIFLSKRRSFAELPWRVFEFGEVFRDEPSGSLSFLLRQRQFCQDDAHVVCALAQSGSVARDWLSMALRALAWMGCGEPILRLASRPESRLGSDAQWDQVEGLLSSELDASGMAWEWAPGEGAFYGPKIELGLLDRLGRVWQMGVFQLDLNLPERFGLRVDGLPEDMGPLALAHHAVFGSVERAIGVLLACHGKNLPPLLSPNALAVVAVSEKSNQAALDFHAKAQKLIGKRAWLCRIDAPLASKIARAKEEGWLKIAVIGAKEASSGLGLASVDGSQCSAEQACEGLMM
jgi:threonyl-tRNA synthetase